MKYTDSIRAQGYLLESRKYKPNAKRPTKAKVLAQLKTDAQHTAHYSESASVIRVIYKKKPESLCQTLRRLGVIQ